MERAQLLLRVTLIHDDASPLTSPVAKDAHDDLLSVSSPTVAYARSFSTPPTNYEAAPIRYVMIVSFYPSSIAISLSLSLSLSLSTNRRQRSMVSRTKQSLLDLPSVDKSNLLGQIFQFIGSKPEEAVSAQVYL